jgi:hypothetical protein
MNTRIARGFACGLLGLLFCGCSANSEIIRSQSPYGPASSGGMTHPQPAPATQACPPAHPKKKRIVYVKKSSSGRLAHHGVRRSTCPPHQANLHGGACQSGYCTPGAHGGHLHSLLGLNGWQPTHNHWHSYDVPSNLSYPPSTVPGGVVVYPYYTVKGPDDFFLQ